MSKKNKNNNKTSPAAMIASVEREDLTLLALIALLVPFTWSFLMSWQLGTSIMGHDAIAQSFPAIRDFIETAHASWKNWVYRPDLTGGVIAHGEVGTPLLLEIGAAIGLSAMSCLNLIVFVFQTIITFLGIRIFSDLLLLWSSSSEARARIPFTLKIALTWLIGFSPVLAWKFSRGHFLLVAGLFIFLIAAASLLAVRTKRVSVTLAGVCCFALLNAIPTAGQQTIFYSIIFGGPILVALAWPEFKASRIKAFISSSQGIFLVLLASLLISLPKFLPMIHYALGTDSSRGVGGAALTYSFTTSTLRDWLTSIPWSVNLFSIGREFGYYHEVNYAFGPLLLLLIYTPWKRSRFLGIARIISAFLAIALSLDLKPISTLLIAGVPFMASFRVPARAILPFALFMVPLSLATLGFHFEKQLLLTESKNSKSQKVAEGALLILISSLVLLFPSAVWEPLSWLAMLLLLVLIVKKTVQPSHWLLSVLIFILSGASLAAFKSRLLPFQNEELLVSELSKVHEQVLQQQPSLSLPLQRVHFNFSIPGLSVNTGYAAGFSTLEGYWFPPRRFGQLVSALQGQHYDPTFCIFPFSSAEKSFLVLNQLYNSGYSADQQNGAIVVHESGPTAGQAWFSGNLVSFATIEELAFHLLEKGSSVAKTALEQDWVVSTDSAVINAALPHSVDARCSEAKVLGVDSKRGDQHFHIRVQTPADCPLTLATNYVSDFKVTSVGGSNGLRTFPAYGSLLGVWVPAGTQEINLEIASYTPTWVMGAQLLGLFLLGCGLFLIRRRVTILK